MPSLLTAPAALVPRVCGRGDGGLTRGPLCGGLVFYSLLDLLALGGFYEQIPRGTDVTTADAPLVLGVEVVV